MPAVVLVILGILFFCAFVTALVLVCIGTLVVEVAPIALIALCLGYIGLGLCYRKCRSSRRNVDSHGVDNVKEETKSLLNVAFVLEGIVIALSVVALVLYKLN